MPYNPYNMTEAYVIEREGTDEEKSKMRYGSESRSSLTFFYGLLKLITLLSGLFYIFMWRLSEDPNAFAKFPLKTSLNILVYFIFYSIGIEFTTEIFKPFSYLLVTGMMIYASFHLESTNKLIGYGI